MPVFNIPEMKAEEFSLWQSMLEDRTGLWLPETRKAFLTTSLHSHMRRKGLQKYQELYNLLQELMVSSLDWAQLVDSLTVHETCFYRDQDALDLVNNYCRNKILRGYNRAPNERQNLQLWSVGCSTGEETYTLALEMEKLNNWLEKRDEKRFYYGVIGVDVSYPALAVAREGIYSGKKLSNLNPELINQSFEHLADGHLQVSDSIRKRTCFMQSNILELEEKAKPIYDVIYCQNVMIYFKQERKDLLIREFERRLKPGGILILGHGEITSREQRNLIRIDNKHCLAYIKKEASLTNISEQV